jgi:hypothetical protein
LSYDSLDNHMSQAGSIERASIPSGMYLAWCANLGLLSQAFEEAHHALVMRVRYREIKGSELLVAGCGGDLKPEHLSDAGRSFTERYFNNYLDDFARTFGDDIYAVEDSWHNYDEIARVLTREYMGPAAVRSADALPATEKRWWQVWR